MRVVGLYRYPVKGFSAEPLDAVALAPGGTFPNDRLYAIENGPSGFDPARPVHLSKMKFVVLASLPGVAALHSRFEDATHRFTLSRDGRELACGDLRTPAGRAAIEQAVTDVLGDGLRGPARVVGAPGHCFPDMGQRVVHIVNLASVEVLSQALGRPVEPARFRANLHVDGPPAFAEFDWLGKQVRFGGVTLEIFHRTQRCAATNVDPATATRDLDLPRSLFGMFGHRDFGVYGRVVGGGTMRIGDSGAVA